MPKRSRSWIWKRRAIKLRSRDSEHPKSTGRILSRKSKIPERTWHERWLRAVKPTLDASARSCRLFRRTWRRASLVWQPQKGYNFRDAEISLEYYCIVVKRLLMMNIVQRHLLLLKLEIQRCTDGKKCILSVLCLQLKRLAHLRELLFRLLPRLEPRFGLEKRSRGHRVL